MHHYVIVVVDSRKLKFPSEDLMPDRYAGVTQWVMTGKPLEIPIVGLTFLGSLEVVDGRHRVQWLKDHGFRMIPVAMSREEAKEYRSKT